MGLFDGPIDHAVTQLKPLLDEVSDRTIDSIREALNGVTATLTIVDGALKLEFHAEAVKKAQRVD